MLAEVNRQGSSGKYCGKRTTIAYQYGRNGGEDVVEDNGGGVYVEDGRGLHGDDATYDDGSSVEHSKSAEK